MRRTLAEVASYLIFSAGSTVSERDHGHDFLAMGDVTLTENGRLADGRVLVEDFLAFLWAHGGTPGS